MSGQDWAKTIRSRSSGSCVENLILAINSETKDRRSNRADVIVACAQILGQSIALAGSKEVAVEIRQGIMALIDGYAMEVATTQGDAP